MEQLGQLEKVGVVEQVSPIRKGLEVGQFKRFEIELRLRGYSQKTIHQYLYFNEKFLTFCKESPRAVNKGHIRAYLFHLIEEYGAKPRTVNLAYSALKSYYDSFNNKSLFKKMRRVKIEKDLPTVLTRNEIERMIHFTRNLKHKILLELLYGSGLRVGAAVNLKIEDIYLERNMIKVKNGKGNKDRYVIVSDGFVKHVRQYLAQRKDDNPYLFDSIKGHISIRTAEEVTKQAADRAEITKNVYPHALRASFATELFHNGVDTVLIQKLMGHSDIKTTKGYLGNVTRDIEKVKSPLDI